MTARRKKESEPTLTSLHLPFDLTVEILCRLSVKHLIRLCCVCKSWNSLIFRDSKFAKKHLRKSTSSHDRHHLILTPTYPYFSPQFFLLHSPISSILNSTSTTIVKQFSYYIREILIERAYGNRASTCDGIVCFKIDNSSAVLCNPFIRKFKILPPLKYPSGEIFYTLVHDRFINNYKIIAVNCTRSSKIEVNVHILGTNHWRRIRDFPDPNLILVSRLGTFVNDSLNWLVYAAAPFVVSLDLEKESYEKLALPVSYQKLALPVFPNISSFMTIGTLKGCLSLVFDKRDKSCDVWIMKEYGNEKSWTKLLTVPHMKECDFYSYTRALYISEDDKVLMEYTKMGIKSLVVYDSINNTFMIPEFQNYISNEMTPEVYVESLISPC
ncbi:F-box/kelch-repeat protein At3g23880-like [Vicia villosa]|uniref:F-box/kelch-repeat protein At3g23880-like n=1 Tax=Vicia villosa TaxID=3911 RepID=UPI00273CA770|nr:F-box/kelch-repeat protein At3g23880-like [Vicia villosa]